MNDYNSSMHAVKKHEKKEATTKLENFYLVSLKHYLVQQQLFVNTVASKQGLGKQGVKESYHKKKKESIRYYFYNDTLSQHVPSASACSYSKNHA